MEFKIDTKEHYTVISPSGSAIDAPFADELAQYIVQLGQNGSENYIVDLENVQSASDEGIDSLVSLHETVYGQQQSLVFANISNTLLNTFKQGEKDTLLNLAPKMIEAIDIVSMEILERELWNEE